VNENNIMQLKIGLCGATGKTSNAIAEKIIILQNQFKITAEFSSKNSILELPEFCIQSDLIIDFSNIAILPELLKQCAAHKKPLVIGTTGLDEEHMNLLRKYSAQVPIIYSANMSLGANLLASLLTKCAKLLPSMQYDTEIIEYHHRYKKDAPSGTALTLARAIAEAKNIDFKEILMK
jgi:4-hydroxy-tetrahydrodipicolinate reductase